MKYLIPFFFLVFFPLSTFSQSKYYKELEEKICKGWNTWSYGSMLQHVLLPEGLSVQLNLRQSFIGTPGDRDFFVREFTTDTSGLVRPIAHTFDGSYTELLINNWKGNTIRVQSASKNNEMVILVTPISQIKNIKYYIELEAGILWNRNGTISRSGNTIIADFITSEYIIRSTNQNVETFHPYASPYLAFKGDSTIGFYTGTEKTLAEVKTIIEEAENDYHSYALKYGNLAEGFKCIESVLGWNTIYDPDKNRAITPVTRGWNEAWQGYVLFEWDTYFAALLFALDNKDLAYSNAIAMSKGLNQKGYVGQWQMPGMVAQGISQPPVGSLISWLIYEKYREKWFLEEMYNELLSWNRWWEQNRVVDRFLTWGCEKGYGHQMAAWESGLDNSPMYDEAKMVDVGNNSVFDIADVGLNSMYVADCKYLAKIARELGKADDSNELLNRASEFTVVTKKLWDKKTGTYRNWFTNEKKFSEKLSPTLFYPMLAGIPDIDQSERLIKDHFYNPEEFYSDYMLPSIAFNDIDYDNNYWQGAIWGPMNFLVYMGLVDYNKDAASELAGKSYEMFINSWEKNGAVLENINSANGPGNLKDQLNSNYYYHWGALMGIMKFMEYEQF